MVDGNFGYKSGDEDIQNFIPKITVMGIGGAGCNAVNNMITQGIDGVDFVVANTDAQSLILSKAGRKIQLGKQTTRGFGAGSRPEVGEKAAEESLSEITDEIKNANILFLTAGMGGGTGSGALPVVAKIAREKGILTVAIVTTPFEFEGKKKAKIAEEALARLVPNVDSYIVLPNQNLYSVVDKQMTFLNAFKVSDNVLCEGVKNITDLIRIPGTINLDFADIRAVMENSGRTIIGTSIQDGEDRAVRAVDGVLLNPMLQGNDVRGAKSVLVNITANPENLSLDEPETIMNNIRASIDSDETNFYLGTCFDEKMGDSLKVAIIATGLSEVRGSVSSRVVERSVSANGGMTNGRGSGANIGAGVGVEAVAGAGAGLSSGVGFGIGGNDTTTNSDMGKPVSMKALEEEPLPISEMFGDKVAKDDGVVDSGVKAGQSMQSRENNANGSGFGAKKDDVRDVNAGHSFNDFLRANSLENSGKDEQSVGGAKSNTDLGMSAFGGMSIDDFINKESERIKRENSDMLKETEKSDEKQDVSIDLRASKDDGGDGDDDPNNPSGGPKGGKKNALSSLFLDMLGDTTDDGFMKDNEDVFGDKDNMVSRENIGDTASNVGVNADENDVREEPDLEIKSVADRKPEHEESNVVFLAGSLGKSSDERQIDLMDVLQKMEETFEIPSIFKKSR